MKELLNLAGGAVKILEQGGDFYVEVDGSLGGGDVAGWLSGKASIKLGTGTVGLKAAEAFLNHLLPASIQPYAEMVEGIINAEVAKL